jgi:hypothetical protein
MTFAPKNISRDKSTHMFNGSSRFAPSYVIQPPKIRGARLPMYFNPRTGQAGAKKRGGRSPLDLSISVQDHQSQHQQSDQEQVRVPDHA